MITRAKVTLTVEAVLDTEWSEECTMAQIIEQATAQAIEAVKRHNGRMFHVVGIPTVEAITTRRRGA